MDRLCAKAIGLAVLLSLGLAGWGQGESNLSADRGLGGGARWLPAALTPVSSSSALTLGPIATLHYWLNEGVGFELGGWVSGAEDSWASWRSTTLAGGLLLKLSDNSVSDFYLVGRAISLHSQYTTIALPDGVARAIVPPWPSYESRSLGLAVELAGGIEWSWSSQVATVFEVGLAYVQTITTQTPPPPVEPPEGEPVPLPGPQTSAATGFGITLRVGISFYFPRK